MPDPSTRRASPGTLGGPPRGRSPAAGAGAIVVLVALLALCAAGLGAAAGGGSGGSGGGISGQRGGAVGAAGRGAAPALLVATGGEGAGPASPVAAAAAAAQAEAPRADEARAEARRILSERRFKPSSTPRPLRGVLRRLGSWIRPVVEPVGRLLSEMSENFLGRLILVIAVIGVAALTSIRLIRRRNAAGVAPRPKERRRRQEDPAELERRADHAEREGHLELAFRLRFRAGLLRLDVAGLVPYRLSITTGQLTQTVHSATFKALATAFDEIAYGGRPAAPADLEAARAGWPHVLQNPEIDDRTSTSAPGDRSGAKARLRTPGSPTRPDVRREEGAAAPPTSAGLPSALEPGDQDGAAAPPR